MMNTKIGSITMTSLKNPRAMTTRSRVFASTVAIILVLNFFACGGGGGSNSKQNFVQPPPPPVPQLTITTTSLASGSVSQFYSATLQASGGTGNHTWAITRGALPQG